MNEPVLLSDEQRVFVLARPDAHLLLQSWAGTGKTHTLVERVVHLLSNERVDPGSIVITTFTVEGAKECYHRLHKRLGFGLSNVNTMDSLARRYMLEYGFEPDYYTGVPEYGGLLLNFLRREESLPLKKKVKYMFVDEFQDLSEIQFETVMEFYKSGTIVVAIGDLAQNIYEWRGCYSHFMSSLPDRVPGILDFKLTINRRCTPEILDVGNACLDVALNSRRKDLMIAARPSLPPSTTLGRKPYFEILRHRHRTVLDLVVSYHRDFGVPYGDIAVIGRHKTPLFDAELSLVKEARFNRREIPYVTSVTTGDVDNKVRRRRGHVTLTTVHQSKGLEWPVVILLLWSPPGPEDKNVDEEWRLLYVATTRARDRLHIACDRDQIASAFFSRVSPSLFHFCSNEGDWTRLMSANKTETKSRTSRGVVDVVNSLQGHHYLEMEERSLLPRVKHLDVRVQHPCKRRFLKSHDNSQEGQEGQGQESKESRESRDSFQIEFGNFIDRYLSRLIWETHCLPSLCQVGEVRDHEERGEHGERGEVRGELEDRDARQLLETLLLPADQYWTSFKYSSLIDEFVSASDGDYARILGHIMSRDLDENISNISNISNLKENISSLKDDDSNDSDNKEERIGDLRILYQVLRKMSSHSEATGIPLAMIKIKEGVPLMHSGELKTLRNDYDIYRDPKVPTSSCVFRIFKIALCPSILSNRKAGWYKENVYLDFVRELGRMTPCIKAFVASLDPDVVVKPLFQYSSISRENGESRESRELIGEADIEFGDSIIDCKCSTRTDDKKWLVQCSLYVAMSMREDISKIKIFNPLLHTLWHIDCCEWPMEKRKELLEYVMNIDF